MSKIALGTAQFGMDYGISNTTGQVSDDAIKSILDYCSTQKIEIIDTARAYGNSEIALGRQDLSSFKVITKLMASDFIEHSLENLKLDSIYGLMFHREEEVADNSWKKFSDWKNQGLVEKIGVSVYSTKFLRKLLYRYPIDIFQFPLNILDQRFLDIVPELVKRNIEIHTRSTFLQGLLLMQELPDYFDKIKFCLKKLSPNNLIYSLKFVVDNDAIDYSVIGVTSLEELKEICVVSKKNIKPINYQDFRIDDEDITNPSRWKIKK